MKSTLLSFKSFFAVLLCLLIASATAASAGEAKEVVFAALPAREVGQQLEIIWTVSSGNVSSSALMLLELTSDRPDVLLEPLPITAVGSDTAAVPLKQGSFTWTIPRFLKTSDSYRIRAISVADKGGSVLGTSARVTLINHLPLSQSTLTLLEPSGSADGSHLEATCLLGETCAIRWDFPAWAASAVPRTLNIALHVSPDGKKILEIAQGVPADAKQYTWQVPNRPDLQLPAAYIVITGVHVQSVPQPGLASYNAASGYPFILESRSQRDERDAKSHCSIDFLAPGPIQTGVYDNISGNGNGNGNDHKSETFLDVPRPTYAPDEATDDSSSNAGSVEPSFMAISVAAMLAMLLGVL